MRKRSTNYRNWDAIMDRLNSSPRGKLNGIMFGSPGSAQATRCRLLAEWDGLKATTKGPVLYLSLEGAS